MAIYKVVICLLILCNCDLISSECDECIDFASCPEAVASLQNDSGSLKLSDIRNALCGFEGTNLTICCSDLKREYTTENHPNLRLLPTNCGQTTNSLRIIGGHEASLYEFPWMALISIYVGTNRKSFQCGGSIINSRYVLTAAHCVDNQRVADVRIGDLDTANETDCQLMYRYYVCETYFEDISIEEIIIHKNYSTLPMVINDIALIRLAKPIDFTHKNAAPVCLPNTPELRNRKLEGQKATVAGWGLTKQGESTKLRKVEVPIRAKSTCSNLYRSHWQANNDEDDFVDICAGDSGKDTCQGDSGGPMIVPVVLNYDELFVQYGITSNGPRECGSSKPSLYTDVTKHMLWILNNIKS